MLRDTITAQVWAMAPDHLSAFIQSVAGLEHMPFEKVQDTTPLGYETQGDIAYIDIVGPMIDRVPEMWKAFGVGAADMSEIRAAVESASADDSIKTIILRMDTPGGTISGTDELARSLKGTGKTVLVHATGLLASAGMWVASHADSIYATPTTLVGSIGVYRVIIDSSAAAASSGYKVHVVSSGGVKGGTVKGAEVSSEVLADQQRTINALNDLFVTAVSEGRGLTEEFVRALNTGEEWTAQEARNRRLVDSVDHSLPTKSAAELRAIQGVCIMQDLIMLTAAFPTKAAMISELHGQGVPASEIETKVRTAAAEDDNEALKAENESLKARIADLESALAEYDKKRDDGEEEAKSEEEEEDEVVEDEDEKEAKKAAAQATAQDFVQGFVDDPGPEASGSGMVTRRSLMSEKDKMLFITENGAEAYSALPW